MVAKAHFNVWIMPEAVSSEPHRWANIEESGAASRIGANGYRVATTSIDYVCQKYDVRPAFLKIDIEGEEINALKGGARLLASEKPTLIFEHGIGDDRAISLLKDCGYALYDVASYKPVASSTDYEPGVQISNILAIHESKIQASPYAKPPTPTTVKTFDESQFIAANPSNSAIKSVSSTLPPGRYVFVLSRATLDKAVDLFCCVKTGKVVLGHLETNGDFFIRNHRSMPFHVESEGEFVFEFGEVARAERASLHVKEVQLWRIDFAEEGAA
jgi:hypothetical protein